MQKQSDEAILQNEHALKILFWERNISTVLDLIDLHRFQQRVRQVGACDKVLYEIQVAALYRNSGYDVTFQDTGQQGYEFRVSNKTGGPLYVECKKKGEIQLVATVTDGITAEEIYLPPDRGVFDMSDFEVCRLNHSAFHTSSAGDFLKILHPRLPEVSPLTCL